MIQLFNLDKALKAIQEGQALTGKDGILTPLIKQLTETSLAAELNSHSPMMLGMALRKRPLKHQSIALSWPLHVIAKALLNLNW